MQIHTYTTYSFDELPEETQEKVIENYRDWHVDGSFWYECIFDDVKAIGELIGIDIENIYFSGFCSQGDGAQFVGSYEYRKGGFKALKEYAPQEFELHKIAKDLQELQRKNFYSLSANVKHFGHYNHEMCTNIQVWNERESMGGANDEAHDSIIELLRDFMRWIYKRLESEYDYLTSDEALKEYFMDSDYQFLENGKID